MTTKTSITENDIGRTFIIDKEFNNASEVKLLELHGHFCKVAEPGNEKHAWSTMTCRLSEKSPVQPQA